MVPTFNFAIKPMTLKFKHQKHRPQGGQLSIPLARWALSLDMLEEAATRVEAIAIRLEEATFPTISTACISISSCSKVANFMPFS